MCLLLAALVSERPGGCNGPTSTWAIIRAYFVGPPSPLCWWPKVALCPLGYVYRQSLTASRRFILFPFPIQVNCSERSTVQCNSAFQPKDIGHKWDE
jgi:hypothetical protein